MRGAFSVEKGGVQQKGADKRVSGRNVPAAGPDKKSPFREKGLCGMAVQVSEGSCQTCMKALVIWGWISGGRRLSPVYGSSRGIRWGLDSLKRCQLEAVRLSAETGFSQTFAAAETPPRSLPSKKTAKVPGPAWEPMTGPMSVR